MSILLKFYAVAIVVMLVLVVRPLVASGEMPGYISGLGKADMMVWILYQWMATAVADEILFHGLFQTLLLKYWRERVKIFSYEFPVVILFTSIAFAAGRTNVPVYGGHLVEYVLALLMGLYRGNCFLPYEKPAYSHALTGILLRSPVCDSVCLPGDCRALEFDMRKTRDTDYERISAGLMLRIRS